MEKEMTLGNNQFRNIRLSFINFLLKNMATTSYSKNQIIFRGEANPKLITDNVRCRLDINNQCSMNRLEYKKVESPVTHNCNTYTCPFWMPTFMNLDQIDFQANDRRILRLDFMNRELVNSRYNVIQIGIWSNKGDDLYKHKLYLLRDTVMEILDRDKDTKKEKMFTILDWDNPQSPPPALEGSPQVEMSVVIHVKEVVTRPVATNGEFGEVFTIWLVSNASPRLVTPGPGE